MCTDLQLIRALRKGDCEMRVDMQSMVVFKLEWVHQGTYEQTRSLRQKGQLDAGI